MDHSVAYTGYDGERFAYRAIRREVYRSTPQGELFIDVHLPYDWTPQDASRATGRKNQNPAFSGTWRVRRVFSAVPETLGCRVRIPSSPQNCPGKSAAESQSPCTTRAE